ncbi:MAG: helix-turn-helix transcriptional regulator [Janthinobacterium lividum]
MDDPDLFHSNAVTEVTSTSQNARTRKSSPLRTTSGEDPLLKYVANQIVSARQRLGITQDQLAEKAGCAPLTVTNIESGRRNVTLKSLSLLATALEIDLRDLFPPARLVSRRRSSEDFAKLISESLGKITSAVNDVEVLLGQETDQPAS